MLEKIKQYKFNAIISRDGVISYEDLTNLVIKYKLEIHTKINENDCVVINSDYSQYSIALLLALIEINVTIVPIIDSTVSEFKDKLEACNPNLIIEISDAGDLKFKFHKRYKDNSIQHSEITKAECGLILFSSGTTGKPKTMLINLSKMLSTFSKPKKQSKLTFLVFLLFDHIGGLNTLLSCLNNGSPIVIPDKRDPSDIINLIDKNKINVLPTSPTFLNLMFLDDAFDLQKLSSLRLITYGTERMPQILLEKINKKLPRVKLLQTFGTSETGILKTVSKSSDSLFFKIDDPDREYKILDGELYIRSKTGIKGYLDHDNSNFKEDGWFATGDLVEESGDGYIQIVGRKNDVINVGGLKAMPSEIENVISQVLGVIDVLVYGEENVITGNMVCCKIVKEEGIEEKALKRDKTVLQI